MTSSIAVDAHFRKFEPQDIVRIKSIASDVRVFIKDEVDEIANSIQHYEKFPEGDELLTYVYNVDGDVAGFVSFGLGLGNKTYEIYWLGVSPTRQRAGIGSKILRFVEELVKSKGGRIIFIETSSKKDYEPARHLYERMGYVREGSVKDYFDDGDDKVVYSKRIKQNQ
ncbi:Acetyltransferase (GNAT) family protein [uncultured archaeon]|nr:Acetyltransferase (GNAT) family protein [uncultured archaeon]